MDGFPWGLSTRIDKASAALGFLTGFYCSGAKTEASEPGSAWLKSSQERWGTSKRSFCVFLLPDGSGEGARILCPDLLWSFNDASFKNKLQENEDPLESRIRIPSTLPAHVPEIIWWQWGFPSGWDEQRWAQLCGEVECGMLVRSWVIAEWPNGSYLISLRFLLCQMPITKYSIVGPWRARVATHQQDKGRHITGC